MRPDQLDLLTSVDAPTLTPDGDRLVVGTSRPDFRTDGYTGQLWVMPTDGSAPPRRLTQGYRDSGAQLSPDGTTVAFLRSPAPDSDSGAPSAPQLALIPLDGGESRIVTDRRLGVTGFAWSPDSRWITFSSPEAEPGRYGTVAGVGPGQEDPRLVTGPDHRLNGEGYTADKRPRLFEIEVPDPKGEPVFPARGRMAEPQDSHAGAPGLPAARPLTGGERAASDPVYAADSRHVFFATTPESGFGQSLRTAVAVVEARSDAHDQPGPSGSGPAADPDAGPVRLVAGGTEARVGYGSPCVSRNGEWLYLMGQDLGESGLGFVASNGAVYALPAASAVREATIGWDRPATGLQPRLLTDPAAMGFNGPLRPSRQDQVLALGVSRGRTVLVRVSHQGQPEVIVDQQGEVTGACETGGTLAVSSTSAASPGAVGILRRGSDLLELFDPNAAWRADLPPVAGLEREYGGPSRDRPDRSSEPEQEQVRNGDQDHEQPPVHGWVFLPEGPGPHPVILTIHGGPYAQYTWSWFDETQVLVAAGYAVVMCNPRGSDGYGADHGASIQGRMGTVDYQDILAFLDGALEEFGPAGSGQLDARRIGVQGGSYGGYMTAWITAHDHRFTAAIVERGYLDPVSALGSSDIGWFFSEQYMGSDPERLRQQSPLHHVDRVRTPTLVIHSEEDLRCPIEHAQRYYQALWARGVEAELLIFPGEDHELSRSGTPWHRRVRFDHILRWWDRHLARQVTDE
ncbi:alpha/beta hydrolase family protein [Citricoccus muralis]|uniref:Dipeptidyl aminopeptidase/acylaminoacyl peptidase n=1 Tax=Citricoccus muralis TaxID=169134 RepID=A0A3D9L9T6_9MICC|nr:S9 family peptidase [Citricoccus muralis]REE03118.1 dipeptidyl aminopeptidase/acylaminoacyl peptidase [Citricoccus muralis]